MNKEKIFDIVANKEYEIIKQCVSRRRDLNLSQEDIIKITGLNNKDVLKLETLGSYPTLQDFLIYITSLGLSIKLEENK